MVNTVRGSFTSELVLAWTVNPCWRDNGGFDCPINQASVPAVVQLSNSFQDNQADLGRPAGTTRTWQFNDTFSWFVPDKMGGDHDVKVGVHIPHIARITNTLEGEQPGNGSVHGSTPTRCSTLQRTRQPTRSGSWSALGIPLGQVVRSRSS